jgi:hypothetical protein
MTQGIRLRHHKTGGVGHAFAMHPPLIRKHWQNHVPLFRNTHSYVIHMYILQAYLTTGEFLRMLYRHTLWYSPANVAHSFGDHLITLLHKLPAIVLCSVSFVYDCYVKTNSYTTCRIKFRHKFPRHNMSICNFQINEESSNPRQFNWKSVKNKSCFNWGKTWWHRSSIRKFSWRNFTAMLPHGIFLDIVSRIYNKVSSSGLQENAWHYDIILTYLI